VIASTTERPSSPRAQSESGGAKETVDTSDSAATDENRLDFTEHDHRLAFTALFARHARAIRSIASRILRDTAEAEDLLQDFFLFIQRKSSSFDSLKGSAGSWIIQMAYQRAIDRRRRLTARHFYDRENLESAASELVGTATTEDDYSPETVFGRNGLEKVIGELSEDQQETLRLYFFEGYTLAEISVRIGQPLGNVRNHYYRALDKLRKHMFGRKVRNG